MRHLKLVCCLILLLGLPLIWRAWPPVPAPVWRNAIYWSDTRGNSGWVFPDENGDIEILTFNDGDIQVTVIEYAGSEVGRP